MEGATQAGLVTKWLKRYPFGNFRAKENKMKSINRLLGKDYNDPLMHIIMLAALSSGECHRQLIQCGLTDIPENSLEDNDEMKWSFHNGPIPPNVSPSRQNGRRRREESQEERALRRRRREAMVLGENGRPIARDDIIEQNATAPSEEFQPELN